MEPAKSVVPDRAHAGKLRLVLAWLGVASVLVAVAGCGMTRAAYVRPGVIAAVGAENQYASVISQIGGRYVSVAAIQSNPNTDPHAFEASPSVVQAVASARLVVQNGLGYDDYMNRIEAATPSRSRRVLVVQRLLGLPDSTPNPHLWYAPRTMPVLAGAIASALSALQPRHAAYFRTNLARFDRSLWPWYRAIAAFRRAHPGLPVAVTEPVGDYLLQALGARVLTPYAMQADVMNGVDVPPQDVSLQDELLSARRVKVLLYNRQVTDPLTRSYLAQADRARVPVVGVYETMPTPGYDYQSWMMAELRALERAVDGGVSTRSLGG